MYALRVRSRRSLAGLWLAAATVSAFGQSVPATPEAASLKPMLRVLKQAQFAADRDALLEIQFPKPMITEDQIGSNALPNLLDWEPPLSGEFVWRDTQTARFHSTGTLPMGQTYSASLAKNLAFLDETEIGESEVVSLQTEPLSYTYPRALPGTEEFPSPCLGRWLISFNHEVDPKSLADRLVFMMESSSTTPAKDRPTTEAAVRHATIADFRATGTTPGRMWAETLTPAKPFSQRVDDELVANAVVVSPAKPLAPGVMWYLFSKQESRGPATDAFSWNPLHQYIGLIPWQRVRSAESSVSLEQPPGIRVNFEIALSSNADLAKLITVTPPVENLAFKLQGNSALVTGKFALTQTYRVCVAGPLSTPGQVGHFAPHIQDVEIKPLEPSIGLPSFDEAQLASGSREYAISTVNLASLRLRVKRLSADESVQAMRRYAAKYKQAERVEQAGAMQPIFDEIPGQLVAEREWKFERGLNTADTVRLTWDEILTDKQPATLFISAVGEPKPNAGPKSLGAEAIVHLTDIGLAWRLSPNEALLYAFSCDTGLPLPKTEFVLHGKDGAKSASVFTDDHGTARVSRHQGLTFLTARLGADQFTVPFDRTLPKVPLWRFPVEIDWRPDKDHRRVVMMFTDRGLYRPGETVHLKGIVRRRLDADLQLPLDKEAEFAALDREGKEFVRRKIALSEHGTFAETFTLPRESVGAFTALVEFPREASKAELQDNQVDPELPEEDSWMDPNYDSERASDSEFRHTFRVEEFRKNTFEITMKPSAPPIGASRLLLPVEARYYMGQPLSDAKVLWHARVTSSGFYPDSCRDFLFGDHQGYDPYYWAHYFGVEDEYEEYGHRDEQSFNGEQFLKPDGTTSIDLVMPRSEFPTARRVAWSAEITDVNQQTLTESSSLTVHPADFYLGLARTDRLVRAGERVSIPCLAVGLDGKPWPNEVAADFTVEQEVWRTTTIRAADGSMRTLNQGERAEVQRGSVRVTANQARIEFQAQAAGTHYVTVRAKDAAGRETATRIQLYVYGSDDYAWEYEDGARIKLVPEKRRYQPGETAHILVMTPIDGTALVTLERSQVVRAFTTPLSSQNPVLEVPLTDEDSPNVYVSVTVIKGAAENRRVKPAPIMKLGYCSLEVENRKDRLQLAVDVSPSTCRPGATVEAKGTVTDVSGQAVPGAEVTLWAVDEGVLSVIDYKTPDPLAELLPKLPLAVRAGVSLSLFIPERANERSYINKGFVIGDGDGPQDLARKLRGNFTPCAFWSANLLADERGRFSAHFATPDSLTRYRVMAVALHGARRMGHGVSALTVNKPLMLEPVVPRFANVGDRLVPKAVLHNTSTVSGEFAVSLELGAEAKFLANGATKNVGVISLEAGETKALAFEVQFVKTGEAAWRWRAEPTRLPPEAPAKLAGELVDWVESKFRVQYPAPLMREVHYVTVDPGQTVDLLRDFDPNLAARPQRLELELSVSRFVEAAEALSFNLHYPYG